MRPVRIILAALAIASGLAVPVVGGAASFVFFRTPSGNITCVESTSLRAYLRCDIRSGLKPRPAKPRGCQLDWGFGFTIDARSRAVVTCAGDSTNEPGSKVIPYGATWRLGPFRCTSRPDGLRCSNRGAHGFFLSRARSYRF